MKWSGTEHGRFDETTVAAVMKTWSYLTPPIRPAAPVQAEFSRHFAATSGQPVLLFGATPELIDLANHLGCPRIVAIDWNADNFEAMRRLAHTDWARVEFRHGNWTVLDPELAGAFGCVACDGGSLFLRFPEEWRRVSAAAWSYLQPGGRWVNRAVDWPADDPPFEACLRRYIDEFLARRGGLGRDAELAAFRALTVHARVRSFQRVTGANGLINHAELARRNDSAAQILFDLFPEPEFREITDMNLLRLARPDPGRFELVSILSPEMARGPIEELGFTTELTDLKSVPPGCDYVLAAVKP